MRGASWPLPPHVRSRFGRPEVADVAEHSSFGRSRRQIGQAAIAKPLTGREGTIDGGDDTLNWLWIGDAARAVGRAVDSGPLPLLAYNVSGDLRPMRDAVTIMRGLIPGAEIAVSGGTLGLNYPMDASAVRRDLGFEFETNLEAQLRELTERMRTMLGRVTPSRSERRPIGTPVYGPRSRRWVHTGR